MKFTRGGFSKGQRGFTLIEIMIVLAVLAVLAAVVIPSVSGFLGRSKKQAFDADRRQLQVAVDAWRTDVSQRVGNPWPTVSGKKGAIMTVCLATDAVDIVAQCANSPVVLVSALNEYLKGTDAVRSFAWSTGTGSGATNSPKGSYAWYIDDNGVVQARLWTDTSTDVGIVDRAELAGSDGFVTDTYP